MEGIITFNDLTAIATILLSVIAIVIAIYTSRQTSKDATRQIKKLTRLTLLQIDAELLQLEVEIFKSEVKDINAKDEIRRIQEKMEELRSDPNVSDKQIDDFRSEIDKLNKNASIQKAWWFKLFNTQASLVFLSQKIKQE